MTSNSMRPPRGSPSSSTKLQTGAKPKSQHPSSSSSSSSSSQSSSLFRQKVSTANPLSICNSSSASVGRMSMRQILTSDKYCVPIFQRRYCWNEMQWQTLLDDAIAVSALANTGTPAASTNSNAAKRAGRPSTLRQHSLGRLTCTSTHISEGGGRGRSHRLVGIKGRSIILDGQQRFTSVSILLAAIRDSLLQRNKRIPEESKSIGQLASLINNFLFLDVLEMRHYQKQQQLEEEGAELSFARVIPTFCDRRSYFAAILPPTDCNGSTEATTTEEIDKVNDTWHRPLQAKQFFQKALRDQGIDTITKLQQLLNGILHATKHIYI